jgi:hypothetical protein
MKFQELINNLNAFEKYFYKLPHFTARYEKRLDLANEIDHMVTELDSNLTEFLSYIKQNNTLQKTLTVALLICDPEDKKERSIVFKRINLLDNLLDDTYLKQPKELPDNSLYINIQSLLALAVDSDSLERVQLLIEEKGAPVNADFIKHTIMRARFLLPQSSKILKPINEKEEIIETIQSILLYLAQSYQDTLEICETLLKTGHDKVQEVVPELLSSNVNWNSFSKTIIHIAAQKGCIQLVEFLIEERLDSKFNCSSIDQSGRTFVDYAAENGHLEIVRLARQKTPDLLNSASSRATLINLASQNGHLEVVNFLLQDYNDYNYHNDVSKSHIKALAPKLVIDEVRKYHDNILRSRSFLSYIIVTDSVELLKVVLEEKKITFSIPQFSRFFLH